MAEGVELKDLRGPFQPKLFYEVMNHQVMLAASHDTSTEQPAVQRVAKGLGLQISLVPASLEHLLQLLLATAPNNATTCDASVVFPHGTADLI